MDINIRYPLKIYKIEHPKFFGHPHEAGGQLQRMRRLSSDSASADFRKDGIVTEFQLRMGLTPVALDR
jgi:hypothetical protein